MFFFFTHQPLFARQVLLDYFIFYCCVRQNKANSWKGIWQWGQFQTIKEIIWYCQQPKVATFHCFFSFFRNLTLMKPLWLISPSISLIGDSSWFPCFTLKLWSISIFFWKPNSTGVSWTDGNQQSKSFPQRINFQSNQYQTRKSLSWNHLEKRDQQYHLILHVISIESRLG